jgi:sulfur-carrier protein adenylyltransferase/sulfurtransferase
VLPGTFGCLQATEVCKIILGRSPVELSAGRVIVMDAMAMKFTELKLERQPDRETIEELIDYQGFCAGPKAQPTTSTSQKGGRTMDESESSEPESDKQHFHSLEPKECLQKLTSGWSPYVLDVRLQTEHEIVALPFTDHVSPHRGVTVRDIPKSGDVLVYCKAGVRGKKACNALISQGVDPARLYNLDGGIMRWQKDLDPSMPRY